MHPRLVSKNVSVQTARVYYKGGWFPSASPLWRSAAHEQQQQQQQQQQERGTIWIGRRRITTGKISGILFLVFGALAAVVSIWESSRLVTVVVVTSSDCRTVCGFLSAVVVVVNDTATTKVNDSLLSADESNKNTTTHEQQSQENRHVDEQQDQQEPTPKDAQQQQEQEQEPQQQEQLVVVIDRATTKENDSPLTSVESDTNTAAQEHQSQENRHGDEQDQQEPIAKHAQQEQVQHQSQENRYEDEQDQQEPIQTHAQQEQEAQQEPQGKEPLVEEPQIQSHPEDSAVDEELVLFLPKQKFDRDLDYFSATWWQSKERFLKIFEPKYIQNVEGAVFNFVSPYVQDEFADQVRMTADWLQFSVEHLSKAWKITGFAEEKETPAYHMFVDKLLDYTVIMLGKHAIVGAVPSNRNAASTSAHSNRSDFNSTQPSRLATTTTTESAPSSTLASSVTTSAMPETIALVAFMPYHSEGENNPRRGQVLTTANLAATLTSLIRVSCGRILIVVNQAASYWNDATASIMTATQEFLLQVSNGVNDMSEREQYGTTVAERQRHELEFLFLLWSLSPKNDLNSFIEYKVHDTEIAVVFVNCTTDDETKLGDMAMVPKAALLGLQKAFQGDNTLHSQQWLGMRSSGYPYPHHGVDHAGDTATTNNNNNHAPDSKTQRSSNEDYNNNRADRWKYVYLTEPDTILQARHTAMLALSRELKKPDQGGGLTNILVPHRLQPIPHARDLPNYFSEEQEVEEKKKKEESDDKNATVTTPRVVPARGEWAQVQVLSSDDFACCDLGPQAPGFDKYQHIGFWWQCGFDDDETDDDDDDDDDASEKEQEQQNPQSSTSNDSNDKQKQNEQQEQQQQQQQRKVKDEEEDKFACLNSYQMIDLSEGTRIVSLAGTAHGRQCLPQPRTATSCAASVRLEESQQKNDR
ncbi:hypothetical protein ACA910_018537 [Epithemia clementina (nom. ined.)]